MGRKKRTDVKKSIQRVKVTFVEEAAVQLIQDTNDAMKRLSVSVKQDKNEAKTNVATWSDKYDQEMNNNVSSVEEKLPIFKFSNPLNIEDEISLVVKESELSALRKETFYPHHFSSSKHGADIMKSTEGDRCRRANIIRIRRLKKNRHLSLMK